MSLEDDIEKYSRKTYYIWENIIDILTENTIKKYQLYSYGRGEKCSKKKNCYIIAKIIDTDTLTSCVKYKYVDQTSDYIGIINFNYLDNTKNYIYCMCYIHTKLKLSDSVLKSIEMIPDSNISFTKIKLEVEKKSWSFAFGSCRYQFGIGPIKFFGSGSSSDKIYKSIYEQDIEFFMSIGDQVYLDPMGPIFRNKKLSDIRKKYREIRSYPDIKKLYSSIPIYEICDDHDIHRNNSNASKKIKDINTYCNSLKAYTEYQHYDGPRLDKPNLYYIFYRQNATFFVMDTRSERDERLNVDNIQKTPNIIGSKQLLAIQKWATSASNSDKIKFLISSVPVVSQPEMDSFYGFPSQQKQLLEILLGLDENSDLIQNLFILVGDTHCARIGQYYVYDKENKYLGDVTEIISSGLVAITHDKGKYYEHGNDLTNYNTNNDFPYCVDNTNNNGLKFTTVFSSKSHPSITNRTLDKILYPFKMISDNVFTKITINSDKMIVLIYNQSGSLLDSIDVDLDININSDINIENVI